MERRGCCAVIGQPTMRFSWGIDEEDAKCRELKLKLLQQIMELIQQGTTQFAVVADYGIGLYAGEMVNVLREADNRLQLLCVTPHEGQATKWAPYLRERYFNMLVACTHMEAVSLRETPSCQYEAYKKVVDCADIVVAVYDPASVRNGAVDRAIRYAIERARDIIYIHPDTLEVSRDDKTLYKEKTK